MRQLFADDQERFSNYSIEIDDQLLVDYSRNIISDITVKKLLDLACQTKLPEAIQAMFRGEKINQTEDRAVLHVALRNLTNTPIMVDGEDVMPQVAEVLEKMERLSSQVISGERRGFGGHPITDVVNIGTGGSYLGPLTVTEALKSYQNHLKIHFVANLDGADLRTTLETLNPATTLFLISSKTFTTQETITNANSARDWLLAASGEPGLIKNHFIAMSANSAAVAAFGIDEANHLKCWDWVGGRFSLWSAIGFSVALAVGFEQFKQLLLGAHAMDLHFLHSPLERNLPVIMALLSIWSGNFLGAQSEAVLPYFHPLRHLPSFLQQLVMESNGKSVDQSGSAVNYQTSPIVWGECGTNGEHSFYQLLHQGCHLIPCDFIGVVNTPFALGEHHNKLMAHLFAQARALAFGKTNAEVAMEATQGPDSYRRQMAQRPFKVFRGNRPSNTILLRHLTPYTIGMLLALYEHKVFSQGVVLNIYSFDQWGVELGKQLAKQILPHTIAAHSDPQLDGSTLSLLDKFRTWRDSGVDDPSTSHRTSSRDSPLR